MANIKSAKKRIKVIDKKTARNKRVKDHVKEALRQFDDAVVSGDMNVAAEKSLVTLTKVVLVYEKDRAAAECAGGVADKAT